MKIVLFALLGLLSFPVMAATTVSANALVSMLVWLVVLGLIFWLVLWFIGWIGVPEPFAKVIKVVVGLVALLILINFLLGFMGSPVMSFR